MELNKLYNLDALKGLKTLDSELVDLILTDPPYKLVGGGMKSKFSENSGMKRDRNSYSVYSTKGTIFKTPEIKEWIFEFYRILKKDSFCLIMIHERSMEELFYLAKKAGFFLCQLLVMKKQNKVVNPYFFRQCEYVLLFRKGKYKKLNKQGTSNFFEVKLKRGKDKVHPTEKPIGFLKELIFNCSNENDLVFDAFAGSGSTLKAAKQLNRKYLGFEINENFYNKAMINLT